MLAKILSQGQGDEALAEMKRAVELAPERADVRDDLGNILAQRNQFADAEVAFKEALRLEPNLEPAHFHLGVVRLQAQQLEDAASRIRDSDRRWRRRMRWLITIWRRP